MKKGPILDLSSQLKGIAKDLSFLGNPRYPLKHLERLFPQHFNFIQELEDVSTPFKVNVYEKHKSMDAFQQDLERAELSDDLKECFSQRLEDYRTLLSMMENFYQPRFYDDCKKLYGTSHESTQNNSFLYFLDKIPEFCSSNSGEKIYQGDKALGYLRNKLLETFADTDVEVKPSTSLLSDSSAGRKILKLNPFKTYSSQQLDVFLVHEGWVHLGTSLNGASQDEHPWLSTWAPRTTFLQEGLAILTELITGCMTLERWDKVLLRHLATAMAERGSSIQEVYQFLLHNELEELDAFKLTLRVFRGVPFDGGMAFTKELLYLHGLVQLLHHLHHYRTDLRSLWIGKVSFQEHSVILKNWDKLNPKLRYFPIELDDPLIQERLKKLKELSYSIFNPEN